MIGKHFGMGRKYISFFKSNKPRGKIHFTAWEKYSLNQVTKSIDIHYDYIRLEFFDKDGKRFYLIIRDEPDNCWICEGYGEKKLRDAEIPIYAKVSEQILNAMLCPKRMLLIDYCTDPFAYHLIRKLYDGEYYSFPLGKDGIEEKSNNYLISRDGGASNTFLEMIELQTKDHPMNTMMNEFRFYFESKEKEDKHEIKIKEIIPVDGDINYISSDPSCLSYHQGIELSQIVKEAVKSNQFFALADYMMEHESEIVRQAGEDIMNQLSLSVPAS